MMKTLKAMAVGLSMMAFGLLAATAYMGWRCGRLPWWPFQTHHWYLSCAGSLPQYQFHSMAIFLSFVLAGGAGRCLLSPGDEGQHGIRHVEMGDTEGRYRSRTGDGGG
jgi:hypothetical protein